MQENFLAHSSRPAGRITPWQSAHTTLEKLCFQPPIRTTRSEITVSFSKPRFFMGEKERSNVVRKQYRTSKTGFGPNLAFADCSCISNESFCPYRIIFERSLTCTRIIRSTHCTGFRRFKRDIFRVSGRLFVRLLLVCKREVTRLSVVLPCSIRRRV